MKCLAGFANSLQKGTNYLFVFVLDFLAGDLGGMGLMGEANEARSDGSKSAMKVANVDLPERILPVMPSIISALPPFWCIHERP